MSDPNQNTLFSIEEGFLQKFVCFLHDTNRFSNIFNEVRHTINREQISSRVLNHWLNHGLLQDKRKDKKGWHRFSGSDLLWIKIMTKLRVFGLSLETICAVNDHLTSYTSSGSFKERAEIEFYLAYCFFEKRPAYLLVFPNGESLIGRESVINASKQCGSIKDDYISIDIAALAKEVIPSLWVNYGETMSPVESWVSDNIKDSELLSLQIQTRKGHYIVEKTVLKENLSAALAAKSLIKHGRLEETVVEGKANRIKLTTSNRINK